MVASNQNPLSKYPKEIVEKAKISTEDLQKKGYDREYALRFAKAAKSWCERNSEDWFVWEVVILMASE